MRHDPPAGKDVITDSRGRPISREAADELHTARLRVRPAVVAKRMWRRLFRDADRQRLDGDLETSWRELGTVRMWVLARAVSVERAVIEIAHGLDFLNEETVRWLFRELGEEMAVASPPTDRPVWDADSGELRLGDRVIRRLRVLRNPSNIQQILDGFQAAGWPSRVGNPLTRGQERLHQALRFLNCSLEEIRFRSQEGGGAILWEPL